MLLLPLFTFSQDNCGKRHKKPVKIKNQTNKEFKNSKDYLSYKKILEEWKYCISPLGMSAKIDSVIEQRLKQENEQIINPCGDKPEKPKRKKNQSIDDYRKTHNHIIYRQKLKEWKSCKSPVSELKYDKLSNTKSLSKDKEVVNPCGSKPKKPERAEGLNHEEYRQTAEHIAYREELKEWRFCIKKNNNTGLNL